MAKAAKFKVGSSGSGKHTETYGSGADNGGHVGPDGPRFGPGVEAKRVTPDMNRNGGNGRPGVKGMKRYSEE